MGPCPAPSVLTALSPSGVEILHVTRLRDAWFPWIQNVTSTPSRHKHIVRSAISAVSVNHALVEKVDEDVHRSSSENFRRPWGHRRSQKYLLAHPRGVSLTAQLVPARSLVLVLPSVSFPLFQKQNSSCLFLLDSCSQATLSQSQHPRLRVEWGGGAEKGAFGSSLMSRL